MGSGLNGTVVRESVPVMYGRQVPRLAVSIGSRPVFQAVFVVVAYWAGGPGVGGHHAGTGFAGWVFVGVVGVGERFDCWCGDALDLVVGEVGSGRGEAVAEIALSFTTAGVVGEGGD